LGLVNSTKLTSITVTDVEKIPQSIKQIDAANSRLTYVDPLIEKVVTRKFFKRLNLADNIDFNCNENVNWMARYVLCDDYRKVSVQNTRCSTGRLLSDYLKEAVPNPCAAPPTDAPTQAPTEPPTQPPGTTQSNPPGSTQSNPPGPSQSTASTATDASTQPTSPTPKGASQSVANIFLVSAIAVLMAAIKLI